MCPRDTAEHVTVRHRHRLEKKASRKLWANRACSDKEDHSQAREENLYTSRALVQKHVKFLIDPTRVGIFTIVFEKSRAYRHYDTKRLGLSVLKVCLEMN